MPLVFICLFILQGSHTVPIAGGTVLIKKKPCLYPSNVKVGREVHQHVRRFMINRETSNSFSLISGRAKSAFSISTKSKHAW